MARPCTRATSISWLKRQLGCGVVVVELTDDHLDDAFDDAVRWWVGRRGIKRLAAQNLTPGVQEYTMPSGTDEVLEVWFPGVQIDIIAAVNPYAFIDVDQLPVAYQSITGVPGGSFYATFQQIMMHAGTARRIVGSEPTWRWERDTNTLWVFPRNQRTGSAIVRYIPDNITDTTESDEFCTKISVRDRDLILKYARAKSKEMLGRIRGKYQSWPAAGSEKSLDGDTLLTESQAEIEGLNEELIGLSDPVPFITG